jgi:hypothetical protein
MTNDGLVSLTNHVVADLWTCDLGPGGIHFSNNVKAVLSDAQAIRSNGAYTNLAGAFQPLLAARVSLSLAGTNISLTWTSAAPAYVLQQSAVVGGSASWTDLPDFPYLCGASNVVRLPWPSAPTARGFYRARPR